jgi:hypothetical protein
MQAEMLLSGNKPRLFADAAFSQVQVMTNKPKPRPGDVTFVNSPDFETLMSRLGQIRLDYRDVKHSPRTFGHVAIAISELLAI